MQGTKGVQKVRRVIHMDIIHFFDIVSPVITICRYNIAQVIISPHLTTT